MGQRVKISFKEMVLRALPLLLIMIFNYDLFAEERKPKMGIVLVAVGKVDPDIINLLKDDLEKRFHRFVSIGKGMPEPHYAYDRKRNQYLSTSILNAILKEKEYAPYEKILGIVDHDLFVPDLNFVFGEAGSKAAVISLTRLREEFYNLPQDQGLFYKRTLTEAVHELGHTYGLSHCKNPDCVMFFSNSLTDTDRKGYNFCQVCRKRPLKKCFKKILDWGGGVKKPSSGYLSIA